MKHDRVVVTGLGAINSNGHDAETIWSRVQAGQPHITPITHFDVSGMRTQFAAQITDFDLEQYVDPKLLRRLGRYIGFALYVAKQALTDARLDTGQVDPRRAGVILGSAIGGIGALLDQYDVLLQEGVRRISPFAVPAMLIDSAPGQIAIEHGFRGVNFGVVGACASGNYGIGEAYYAIVRGDADVVLAGGVEIGLHPYTLASFERAKAMSARNEAPNQASRPFDAARDGFVLAEGAAMLVLERLEHAQARRAPIYGEILGYSATADAYHLTAPHDEGLGATEAMHLALQRAQLGPEDIDYINAHGTSTPLNDASETKAIKAVFGPRAYDVPISSTKSVTGHLLGAAGAIEAIFSLLALRDGILPPTINYDTPDPTCDLDYVPNRARSQPIRTVLSNSFGFGGHNSSLILGGLNGR
ncbi:MAG: beta-ketoacyl-ACP synthase II [Caldilineales bacterium]|nr:beta-ketoacyl-ACP synthase II [Caldilineales bacterium]